MSKLTDAIEWDELLMLLQQFVDSEHVREVCVKNNQTAYMMGLTAEHHVDLDLFVYYYNEAPSSDVQIAIACGFVGDVGPRKIWDGLNVSKAWGDLTVRLYNCRLFWPPEQNKKIDQYTEFGKIGFSYSGGAYIFRKAPQGEEAA